MGTPKKYDESQRLKGMGDVVAKVAEPVAKVIDKVFKTKLTGCDSCRKRREKLNNAIPFKQ